MLVETKFLGEVEVEDSKVFVFEGGLPGFHNLTKFVIVPIEQDSPFVLLQSTEDKDVGFVLSFPFAFKPDYTFELSEQDMDDLNVEDQTEVVTYAIVTLKDSLANSTINLLAPIVLNMKKMLGKQIVLQDSKSYSLRYPIRELEGSAK